MTIPLSSRQLLGGSSSREAGSEGLEGLEWITTMRAYLHSEPGQSFGSFADAEPLA